MSRNYGEYELAKKAVKGFLNENGRLPNPIDLRKRQIALEHQKDELTKQYQGVKAEIGELSRLHKEAMKFIPSADKNRSKDNSLS